MSQWPRCSGGFVPFLAGTNDAPTASRLNGRLTVSGVVTLSSLRTRSSESERPDLGGLAGALSFRGRGAELLERRHHLGGAQPQVALGLVAGHAGVREHAHEVAVAHAVAHVEDLLEALLGRAVHLEVR